MKAIKVDKTELLKILQVNRGRHRDIFLEAQEGYRKAVIAELEMRLAEARDGKRIHQVLHRVQPMDQTREYDRVIAMLTMSVDEQVLLEEADFKAYVQDQWSWKSQFTSSNVAYSKLLQDEGEEDDV